MPKKYNTELIHKVKTFDRTKSDKYVPLNPSSGKVSEGVKYEPNRLVEHSISESWKEGDRILYKSKKGKSGRALYEDPETWG